MFLATFPDTWPEKFPLVCIPGSEDPHQCKQKLNIIQYQLTLICALVVINSSCSSDRWPPPPSLPCQAAPPPSFHRPCSLNKTNKVNKTCTPNFQRFMHNCWKYDAPRIRILVRTLLSFMIFYHTTNQQCFCVPVRRQTLDSHPIKFLSHFCRIVISSLNFVRSKNISLNLQK